MGALLLHVRVKWNTLLHWQGASSGNIPRAPREQSTLYLWCWWAAQSIHMYIAFEVSILPPFALHRVSTPFGILRGISVIITREGGNLTGGCLLNPPLSCYKWTDLSVYSYLMRVVFWWWISGTEIFQTIFEKFGPYKRHTPRYCSSFPPDSTDLSGVRIHGKSASLPVWGRSLIIWGERGVKVAKGGSPKNFFLRFSCKTMFWRKFLWSNLAKKHLVQRVGEQKNFIRENLHHTPSDD